MIHDSADNEPPVKKRRQRARNTRLPKTAEDVKAMLAVSQGKSVADLVGAASEAELRHKQAELELEKLRKKLGKDPMEYARRGIERALAMAGEHPAETLVRLLHQRDEAGDYTLDARERVSIAKILMQYTTPALKAQEVKKEADVGVTVVVQNFTRPEARKSEVIEVKEA